MTRQPNPRQRTRRFATATASLIMALAVGVVGCSPARSRSSVPSRTVVQNGGSFRPNDVQVGIASYYADKYHGRTTANGEVFDMQKLTAAHRTFPFGTLVRVTHLGNDHAVIVRINDRGPFITGRIIDLSLAAARELDMVQSGLAQVRVEVVERNQAAR